MEPHRRARQAEVRSPQVPQPIRAMGHGRDVCSGLWAVGSGLWALGSGLWALGSGLWTLDSGLWTLDSGLWTLGKDRKSSSELPTSTDSPYQLPSPRYQLPSIVRTNFGSQL